MSYQKEIHTFYAGQTQADTSFASSTFITVDPSTAKPLSTIHTTTPEQLNAAVASAQDAFKPWSQTAPKDRATILLRAAAKLRSRNDELALIETLDTGNALSETSTVDAVTGVDVLEYYAHLVADGPPGQFTKLCSDAYFSTTHEPFGVCAGIGAWNYPLQVALWKSAPCLAAGNCMVYKPSECTPLHAGTFAKIYIEAGLPPGVFNVVYGDGPSVGAPLVTYSGIPKVSFTGQVSTGSKVASEAAKSMKGITMELGGKSPLLVLPDADVEEAADVAMVANFFSSGQVCTNGTRVFVPDNLLEEIQQSLIERCRNGIWMGFPKDPQTNFGPVASAMQRDKINMYIKHGREEDKARVFYDGSTESQKQLPTEEGFWVPPVIFTNGTDDMRIAQEEIFGPVMCILPYNTSSQDDDWLPDLLRRANNNPTGLAAGVV
ncbi:hypothetical protein NW762_012691 [Fusarium torreyae]|uniref:aldehyde dehydrogenase (NAD(+)) n=1 Tax=Fusarium torreyae TaxID=1237075 RepID=A0A9W8RLT4_9HYPO|nr:hypothetical protein NW762_012691 [Fusarium torreyae]